MKLLKILLGFAISLVIVAILSLLYLQHHLDEKITTPKLIFIPKGSTKTALNELKKSGLDISGLDYYIVKYIGYPQAGWIDLKKSQMSRQEFFTRITKSKAANKSIKLIPGETKEIFFEQLAKQEDLNLSLLLNAYKRYAPYEDGVILADSYSIPKGIDEDSLVKYLIEISLKKHKKLSKKYLKSYNQKEWFERYITIASIITKEAATLEEMPIISAVIVNRLKKGMHLQMDGTLNYGTHSHQKVTPNMIKEDSSKFNSYKFAGLPPYPICSVRIEAIDAALKPDKNDYLFFVRDKKGHHTFTNSYKKHLKNIKKSNKK